jgi:hypothetical protein
VLKKPPLVSALLTNKLATQIFLRYSVRSIVGELAERHIHETKCLARTNVNFFLSPGEMQQFVKVYSQEIKENLR